MLTGKTCGALFFVCAKLWYTNACLTRALDKLVNMTRLMLALDSKQADAVYSAVGTYFQPPASSIDQGVLLLHELRAMAVKLCSQICGIQGQMFLVSFATHLIVLTIHLYFVAAFVQPIFNQNMGGSEPDRISLYLMFVICLSVISLRTMSIVFACVSSQEVSNKVIEVLLIFSKYQSTEIL